MSSWRHKRFSLKRVLLWLGLLIGGYIIIVTAVFFPEHLTYSLPEVLVRPKYDFLYTLGSTRYVDRYEILNGKLTELPRDYSKYSENEYDMPTRLFVYDVETGESTEIPFVQAQQFQMTGPWSPDGYTVGFKTRRTYNPYNLWLVNALSQLSPDPVYNEEHKYIFGNYASKKVGLVIETPVHGLFHFYGWIVEE